VKRRTWIALGAGVVLTAYVASYGLWTRVFPAREGRRLDGRPTYGFFVKRPDWEHTFVAFYYPLIRVDEARGGPVHAYDPRWL
jgi:hypothetical protein